MFLFCGCALLFSSEPSIREWVVRQPQGNAGRKHWPQISSEDLLNILFPFLCIFFFNFSVSLSIVINMTLSFKNLLLDLHVLVGTSNNLFFFFFLFPIEDPWWHGPQFLAPFTIHLLILLMNFISFHLPEYLIPASFLLSSPSGYLICISQDLVKHQLLCELFPKPVVLVHFSCLNKMPLIGWLIKSKCLFLRFLEAGNSKLKALANSLSGETSFLLCCILT